MVYFLAVRNRPRGDLRNTIFISGWQERGAQVSLCGAVILGDLIETMRLASPDIVNDFHAESGLTALHHAADCGHLHIVQYLVDHGANINQGIKYNDGVTPLYMACRRGHLSVTELLLGRGADPTITSSEGATTLMIASYYGFPDCVSFCLRYNALDTFVNAQDSVGATALSLSCRQGHIEVARALLEAGADPMPVDHGGGTCMDIARSYNDEELVHLLQVSLIYSFVGSHAYGACLCQLISRMLLLFSL